MADEVTEEVTKVNIPEISLDLASWPRHLDGFPEGNLEENPSPEALAAAVADIPEGERALFGLAQLGLATIAEIPTHKAFFVHLGGLAEAQQEVLAEVRRVKEEYDSLAPEVKGSIDWIFIKSEDGLSYHESLADGKGWTSPSNSNSLTSNEYDYAVNYWGGEREPDLLDTAETQQFEAAQTQLLLQSADAIGAGGKWIGLLADAGDYYVQGDKDSFLPDTGV